jgi:hypothetical protein
MPCCFHVFIPSFYFSLVCFAFHRGTAGNPARYNAEHFNFFVETRLAVPAIVGLRRVREVLKRKARISERLPVVSSAV